MEKVWRVKGGSDEEENGEEREDGSDINISILYLLILKKASSS